MSLFWAQLRRDMLLAARNPAEAATPVVFFLLCALLLGLGADAEGRVTAGFGAIWVVALFANVLATEALFNRDFDDGALEQMLVHARPLYALVMGKLVAHWLVSGLPVVVLAPAAAFALLDSFAGVGRLVASLLLGTPALALYGAIAAALTTGGNRGGLLLVALATPLQLPVLIFGVSLAAGDHGAFAGFALAALLTASLTFAPFAIGKALAISQEY